MWVDFFGNGHALSSFAIVCSRIVKLGRRYFSVFCYVKYTTRDKYFYTQTYLHEHSVVTGADAITSAQKY